MPLQPASAYLFPDRLVLHSGLHTDYGQFACAPFQRLERSAAVEEIGRGVLAALAASRSQPNMPDLKEFTKTFLKGVGVKSNAQLQRSALNVGILRSAQLEFHITHNGGTAGDKKGYQPIPGLEPIHIPLDATPQEIGETLMKAFSLCTTIYATGK